MDYLRLKKKQISSRNNVYVPLYVMRDSRLTSNAKIMYGVIVLKGCTPEPCVLSNKELGDRIGISRNSVSRNIQELVKYGYITSEIDKTNGNIRFLSRMKRAPHGTRST
jgi:predicted HTH transcriptional regulator